MADIHHPPPPSWLSEEWAAIRMTSPQLKEWDAQRFTDALWRAYWRGRMDTLEALHDFGRAMHRETLP